jgi:hypothetical protein
MSTVNLLAEVLVIVEAAAEDVLVVFGKPIESPGCLSAVALLSIVFEFVGSISGTGTAHNDLVLIVQIGSPSSVMVLVLWICCRP